MQSTLELTLILCVQILRNGVVKGNAIGSIFYGVGFSTPGVVGEAFTGNAVTPGRRLLQDPYHLTSKVSNCRFQ